MHWECLKTRNLASSWFEAEKRWVSITRLWTTASPARKEGVFLMPSLWVRNIGFSKAIQREKVHRDCPLMLLCCSLGRMLILPRFAVHLVGPGRWYLLWALEKMNKNITGEQFLTPLMQLSRKMREKRPEYEQRHGKVIFQPTTLALTL